MSSGTGETELTDTAYDILKVNAFPPKMKFGCSVWLLGNYMTIQFHIFVCIVLQKAIQL
jgi:hypothetical protein